MKVYSHCRQLDNKYEAISLEGIISFYTSEDCRSKNTSRYSVEICYRDEHHNSFNSLTREEAEKIFNDIVGALNKE